ncbi:MAG: DUF5679 domain-containing protein [Patescibacteria group bacterium]
MEAYCVKCKIKQKMLNPKKVEMLGRGGIKKKALKGKCPVCGTLIFGLIKI